MQLLPLEPSNPNYEFTTSIDSVPYQFRFRWNSRASAWFMDIREQDDTPIVLGVKVVLGTSLGRRSTHPLFSSGAFRAIDTTNKGLEATLDDLGSRVEIRYFSVVEVEALIRQVKT